MVVLLISITMSAGLSCGSTTIKYLLFFFNFLFAICGLLLVVVGALSLKNVAPLAEIGNHLDSSSFVIIAVGVVIFVIAFYGCCGAVRESNCMLVTFAILLLTIIVIEVIACVLAYMYSGQAKDELERNIAKLFEDAKSGEKGPSEAVDAIQQNLSCCGVNGPASYLALTLRPSCCGGSSPCTPINAYQTGCKQAIEESIVRNGKIVGGVAIGVAVVELLGVWFALGLAGAIKKAQRQSRY